MCPCSPKGQAAGHNTAAPEGGAQDDRHGYCQIGLHKYHSPSPLTSEERHHTGGGVHRFSVENILEAGRGHFLPKSRQSGSPPHRHLPPAPSPSSHSVPGCSRLCCVAGRGTRPGRAFWWAGQIRKPAVRTLWASAEEAPAGRASKQNTPKGKIGRRGKRAQHRGCIDHSYLNSSPLSAR